MQIRNQAGLVTADALRRARIPLPDIEHALHTGELRRIGPGLAALPNARPAALEAIASGWRPTCLSAGAAHGMWVPETADRRLHAYKVRTPRKDAPAGVIPHAWEHSWPEPDAIASIPQLLKHATRCLDLESCVVLADSALNRGLLALDEWTAILQEAPRSHQRVLRRAITTAESGSETRVRLGLEAHRIPIETQVPIPGVGRVDIVVKGKWVIECDSRSHHSAEKDHDRDRVRDLRLHMLGYIVTRLSYPQIWREWDTTLAFLLATFRDLSRRLRRPLSA